MPRKHRYGPTNFRDLGSSTLAGKRDRADRRCFEVEILDAEWRAAAVHHVLAAAESADQERKVIKLVDLGWVQFA